MLRDSVVFVRTRPRAIKLAMITIRKSTHGFPFVSHIWVAYGVPLGGPSSRRSSATNCSPGRAVSFVCEAMRSFLVSTVVTHNTFVWLIFKYSIGIITHRWF